MKVVVFIESIRGGSLKFRNAYWVDRKTGAAPPHEHDRYTKDIGTESDTFPVRMGTTFKQIIGKAHDAKVNRYPVMLTIDEDLIVDLEDV